MNSTTSTTQDRPVTRLAPYATERVSPWTIKAVCLAFGLLALLAVGHLGDGAGHVATQETLIPMSAQSNVTIGR